MEFFSSKRRRSEQIAEMKATIADMREEISKRQNIKTMEKER